MDNWILPENLKKSELEHRTSNSIIDVKNDFSSYRKLLEENDVSKSMIKSHNDINPKNKLSLLKKITDRFLKIKNTKSILNVGCGVGFETKALSEIYNCEITGIEASSDGIAYAEKYNSSTKTKFINQVIDSDFLLGIKFDICFAIEFYPFTRTKDLDFQKNIISAIFKNLNKGGSLIIYHLDDDINSINSNVKELSSLLNKNSTVIHNFHPKIFRLIPSLILTQLICLIVNKLFNKNFGKKIIIFN
jgi:SAM-dependent methyltransferase